MTRAESARRKWCVALRPGWLAMHAFAVLAFVVCLRLAWWQVSRLENGGGLQNIAYALQWPAFGLFGIALWWKALTTALRPPEANDVQTSPVLGSPDESALPPVSDTGDDPELAAYNRYLAVLHELESAQ